MEATERSFKDLVTESEAVRRRKKKMVKPNQQRRTSVTGGRSTSGDL